MKSLPLRDYQQRLFQQILAVEPDLENVLFNSLSLPENSPVNARQFAQQRLSVYRNNVLSSLTKALAAQFPVVQRLVGESFFFALAREYVRAQPPQNPVLTFYGDTFPAYIAASPHCQSIAYLADVAKLEWSCQCALHAADASVLAISDLSAIAPDQLGLVSLALLPGASLMVSNYPVAEIWQENLKAEPGTIQLDQNSTTQVLIYRRKFQVQVVSLVPAAFALLSALHQGLGIARAWQRVNEQYALDDTELAPMLAYLLGLEVFSDYSLIDDTEEG